MRDWPLGFRAIGRWAFQILFNAGAALALLIVDAALIAALSFDRAATIGVSLFAAALLYLPARTGARAAQVRSRLISSPVRLAECGQALMDDGVRLAHDAVDQLLAGGDVVDEADDHAA